MWKKHSPGDGTRDDVDDEDDDRDVNDVAAAPDDADDEVEERNVKEFNLSTLFGLFFNNISVNRESATLEITLFTALLFSKIPSNRDGFIMGSCCVERFRLSFLIIETRGVLISGL